MTFRLKLVSHDLGRLRTYVWTMRHLPSPFVGLRNSTLSLVFLELGGVKASVFLY